MWYINDEIGDANSSGWGGLMINGWMISLRRRLKAVEWIGHGIGGESLIHDYLLDIC